MVTRLMPLLPRAIAILGLMVSILVYVAACGAGPSAQGSATGAATTPTATGLRVGVDVLLENPTLLRGQRVGLITNQTGRGADGRSTIDLLYARKDIHLVALFAPEHGLRGTADPGERIENGRDATTGLPVYSLYGATRKPTAAMLAGLDALVYDIQDVGARYYTYVWTMALAMQAAAEHHLKFVVLDRPDPIGGELVQGNLLDPRFASLLGLYSVPMRYGMTPGELARYLNAEEAIHADLTVVPLVGWKRAMSYDDTGLSWVPPSPNMPDVESATDYPGTCLFEGTNLSVGRGTANAFAQIGAPWLDNVALVQQLSAEHLPGVTFQAVTFTPLQPGDGKFPGQSVHGVRFITTDRAAYDPVRAAVAALIAIQHLHPDKLAWDQAHFDALAGTSSLRTQIQAGASLDEITAGWDAALAAFSQKRSRYLLYT